MFKTVVPGLQNDIFRYFTSGSHSSRQLDILPHDEGFVGLLAEVWHSSVDPNLIQVTHGLPRCEELSSEGAEVVAVEEQLVATNVEPVVREDVRNLLVHLPGDFISLVVQNVKLAWVWLNSGVQRPIVVGPPAVLACEDVLVNLAPTRASMTWHVNLRNDANATCCSVADDLLQIRLRKDFVARVSVFCHLRIGLDLKRPGLGVDDVPMQDI